MTTYTIAMIEDVINFWRVEAPSKDGISLSAPLRALGDVYGRMIYDHADQVESSDLTPAQQQAIDAAMEIKQLHATALAKFTEIP